MFYYGTMDVGNDVVSVGNNALGTRNVVMNLGNDTVGVRDVVADVGNGYICIDCELSLETGWLAMAMKRQQNAR